MKPVGAQKVRAIQWVFIGIIVCSTWITISVLAQGEDGFQSIFDGRSLAGWETPDAGYWTVDDGAITARITQTHPCTVNQYLVWTGGKLADFELKLKSRVNGEGAINNGFQFRSRLLPDHDVCGYQICENRRIRDPRHRQLRDRLQ